MTGLLAPWHEHRTETIDGMLEWIKFPGYGSPFLGCIRLEGRPIDPADARRLLTGIGHPHANIAMLNDQWIDHLPQASAFDSEMARPGSPGRRTDANGHRSVRVRRPGKQSS